MAALAAEVDGTMAAAGAGAAMAEIAAVDGTATAEMAIAAAGSSNGGGDGGWGNVGGGALSNGGGGSTAIAGMAAAAAQAPITAGHPIPLHAAAARLKSGRRQLRSQPQYDEAGFQIWLEKHHDRSKCALHRPEPEHHRLDRRLVGAMSTNTRHGASTTAISTITNAESSTIICGMSWTAGKNATPSKR